MQLATIHASGEVAIPHSIPALQPDLARALWRRGQGLAPPFPAPSATAAAEVVAATGWLYAPGGADIYFSLGARLLGSGRAALEQAVAQGLLVVAPGVRGSTMVVPVAERSLALAVASVDFAKRTGKALAELGFSAAEKAHLGAAVIEVLADGARSAAALRGLLPEGSVRSLGEPGRKIAMGTTLPLVLRLLELEGQIARHPEGGRLDGEGTLWAKSEPAPLESEALATGLARRFLRGCAPATVHELAAWSGLGVRAAQAALAAVEAVPVAIPGLEGPAWLLPEDLGAVAPEPDLRPALLGLRDLFHSARAALLPLVDPADRGVEVETWGPTPQPLGEAPSLHHRVLLVGDRLAGLWDWDPERGEGVWGSFGPLPAAVAAAVEALAAGQARFIREELGHARIYAMEPAQGTRGRVARVRGLWRG